MGCGHDDRPSKSQLGRRHLPKVKRAPVRARTPTRGNGLTARECAVASITATAAHLGAAVSADDQRVYVRPHDQSIGTRLQFSRLLKNPTNGRTMNSARVTQLDGLRGMAALVVVVCHALSTFPGLGGRIQQPIRRAQQLRVVACPFPCPRPVERECRHPHIRRPLRFRNHPSFHKTGIHCWMGSVLRQAIIAPVPAPMGLTRTGCRPYDDRPRTSSSGQST